MYTTIDFLYPSMLMILLERSSIRIIRRMEEKRRRGEESKGKPAEEPIMALSSPSARRRILLAGASGFALVLALACIVFVTEVGLLVCLLS